MKSIIICFLFIASNVMVSTVGRAQVDCQTILAKAVKVFDQGRGDLEKALQFLEDTKTCDYLNELETKREVLEKEIFEAIKKQKIAAEKAKILADSARVKMEIAKDRAEILKEKEAQARKKAEFNEKIAKLAKIKAEARSIALQSLQLKQMNLERKDSFALESYKRYMALTPRDTSLFSDVYNALYDCFRNSASYQSKATESQNMGIHQMTYLNEYRTLVAADRSGTILNWSIPTTDSPWEINTWSKHQKLRAYPNKVITSMVPSLDAKSLAIGSWDGELRLLSTAGGKDEILVNLNGRPISNLAFDTNHHLYFTVGGKEIYTVAASDSLANIWYRTEQPELKSLTAEYDWLIAGQSDGTITIWNTSRGKLASVPLLQKKFDAVSVSSMSAKYLANQNTLLLAIGYENGLLIVLSLAVKPDQLLIKAASSFYHHSQRIADLKFNKDGKLLGAASFDKQASIVFPFSKYSDHPLILDHFEEWAMSIEFASDQNLFYVSTRSGRLFEFSMDMETYVRFILNKIKQGEKSSPRNEETVEEEECLQKYYRLISLFENGNLSGVVDYYQANKRCLSSDFQLLGAKKEPTEVAAILAGTYLLLEEKESADLQFNNLLKLDPYYPVEEKIDWPELHSWQQHFSVSSLSLGIKAGFNWSIISDIRQHMVEGVQVKQENYSPRRWNMNSSGFIAYRPSIQKPWELFFEFHYVPKAYIYKGWYEVGEGGSPSDIANLTFEEKMHWNNFLFYARYNFDRDLRINEAKFSFYGLLGGGVGYLQESNLEGIDITFTEDFNRNATLARFEVTDCPAGVSLRKKVNPILVTGVGLKYKISPRIFFFTEVRNDVLLQNLVREDARYGCQPLEDNFYYVDNDMVVSTFYFTGGVNYQLYYPKRK